MDIRGKRALRSSLLALAAMAVGLLGSAQLANAQTFTFDPSGTGLSGIPTTGLQFAGGNALVTIPGGTAVPLTNGESFTLIYQTHLTGLSGLDPTQQAAFTAALGTGQITESALLTETATITGNTVTFSLTPGGTDQVNLYYNPTTVYNDGAGSGFVTTPATGYALGKLIATLTPNASGYESVFTNFGGTPGPFNTTGAGLDAASGGNGGTVKAVNGTGGTSFSNAVVSYNPSFFNPPSGTPTLTSSNIGSSLNSAFITSISPSSAFTNPLTNAVLAPSIGTINGATGPDLVLRVDGFTQSFATTVVPEPASVTLMGLGVVGALIVVRRTRARVA